MKKQIIAIKVAGSVTCFFSVFHLLFYWLLHWKETLKCLSVDNWAIFHAFNVGMNIMFIVFTFVSLFLTKKLLTETIGKVMLVFMSSIYVMRIVSEFVLWKFNLAQSPVIIILCLIPAVLYLLPLFSNHKNA